MEAIRSIISLTTQHDKKGQVLIKPTKPKKLVKTSGEVINVAIN